MQYLWKVSELGQLSGPPHVGAQRWEAIQMLCVWPDLHHQWQHAQVRDMATSFRFLFSKTATITLFFSGHLKLLRVRGLQKLYVLTLSFREFKLGWMLLYCLFTYAEFSLFKTNPGVRVIWAGVNTTNTFEWGPWIGLILFHCSEKMIHQELNQICCFTGCEDLTCNMQIGVGDQCSGYPKWETKGNAEYSAW